MRSEEAYAVVGIVNIMLYWGHSFIQFYPVNQILWYCVNVILTFKNNTTTKDISTSVMLP